ncbi:MAG: hypothetical protein IPH75_16265 [bacterium]|nr:hypothetical protein [bacterium]
MSKIRIDTCKLSMPLKKKFQVSKGGTDVKTNMLAMLNNRYIGEASGSVHYGPSVEEIEADLKKGIGYLRARDEITTHTLVEIAEFDISSVARSALTGMVLHYLSGESERYPWEVLGLQTPVGVKSSFTIGIDEPSEMLKSIKDSTYPIIKIKLGFDEDIKVIEGLKDIVGKDIRIDANGGWSLDKAEEMIYYLGKQNVRIIEQPTDIDQITDWKHLKKNAPNVELFLDEGLSTLDDYQKVAEFVDGVNIKMEKSGGILEAVRIAEHARQDKRKVMLGCMVESSVGIAQSIYMSSLADYCDLDGPQLLEQDIASGILYQKEQIQVDREIIGGPKLKRDVVEKYLQTD